MTNQNNELNEILARAMAHYKAEDWNGSRILTEAKQAIQALYASKPVENGELREQVLTEFKQVHKLAPADYTENCTNVVMSIIQAHTEKAVREARIDELTSLQHYGSPTQSFVKYSEIEQRLRQLTNKEIT